jgi:hypothetical protein
MYKTLFYFSVFSVVLLSGCSSPPAASDTTVTQTLRERPASAAILDTLPILAKGVVNNKQWQTTSAIANMIRTMGKNTYAILLSDGDQKIVITYSGKEKPSITQIGADLKVSYMDEHNKTQVFTNGFIQFTEFDLERHKLSGKINLTDENEKTSSTHITIDEVFFKDVSW